MANFGQLILTNVGIQEQYKAQSGRPLKFKRIGMGSGRYSGNIMALTKLVTENVSVNISKGYLQNNAYTVEGFFSNDGLQTGFAWREIGLFVEDENGNEVLYCYANAGDTYDYIPATTDERYSKYIRIATAIGNATNISIVENEGILYVDTVTFNTAVEEFRTNIDQLWPSKEKSGSAIAVNDSANLPFVGMNVYGKSEQVKTTGINLLDVNNKATFLNNQGATKTGVVVPIERDGVYSYYIEDSITAYIGYTSSLNENATHFASALKDKPARGTVSLKAGQYFLIWFDTGVEVVDSTYYFLALGTDASYEPYSGGMPSPSPEYPQDIVSIENPTVSICGKNILEPSGTKSANGVTLTLGDDGIYTISGTTTGYININIGNAYIVAGRKYKPTVVVYSGSINPSYWNFETQSNMNVDSKGYLSSEVSTKMSAFIYNDKAGETYNAKFAVMIELVTDVETGVYEHYKKEQTLEISTPNGLAGIPVSSGGNYTDVNGQQWICDEIDIARGVLTKRIGEVDLSTLEWYYNEPYTVFTALVQDLKPDTLVMLCTHYLTSTMNSASSPDMTIYGRKDSNGMGGIGVKNSNYTNAAMFKSAMSGAILLYELEEPIETAITSEQIAAYKALLTNNPNTTILNDAGADMKVQYITKTFNDVLRLKNLGVANYPVEEGTINGWDYRKWYNGTLECWCNISLKDASDLNTFFEAYAANLPYYAEGKPTRIYAQIIDSNDNELIKNVKCFISSSDGDVTVKAYKSGTVSANDLSNTSVDVYVKIQL